MKNKLKRQSTEWEKIFANHVSVKGLIFRVYKEQYNNKIHNPTTMKKTGKILNRHFTEYSINTQVDAPCH